MTKKLAVVALLMFLIITTLIGSTLIKNDFLNPEKEPVVSTTEDKKEEEKKETPKPEVDPETDTRFSDTNSILLLVNKKHKLEETYVPSDLTTANVSTNGTEWTLRKEAAKAIEELFNAAKEDGIKLRLGNGFRSGSYQGQLYQASVDPIGETSTNKTTAKAGYSELQTGLAAAILGADTTTDFNNSFAKSDEYKWLQENAYKYGFILRYPENKESITGYTFMPWHYRYVGKDTAEQIHDAGDDTTFEEFFGLTGGDYEKTSS